MTDSPTSTKSHSSFTSFLTGCEAKLQFAAGGMVDNRATVGSKADLASICKQWETLKQSEKSINTFGVLF